MKHTVQELAGMLGCRVIGGGATVIAGVSSPRSATPESLIFVDVAMHLDAALASAAAAVIAGEFASTPQPRKPLIISPQPRLTFARAAKLLALRDRSGRGIHPSVIVPPSVRMGDNVAIGARAVLGEHVHIGNDSTIEESCVLGHGVKIGSQCRIDPHVTIYSGVTLGDRVIVQAGAVLGSAGFGYVRDRQTGRYEQFPQLGRLVIEDDVEIGANSTIDRGALDETRIRRGTKIDNLVHVGHNVDIGEDVVIAAQTGVSGSVHIEKNVVVGGQVGIADHVRIEEGAILGAQSGIPSKKVIRGKGVVFWGTPARPIREYLKELAFLARNARREK